MKRRPLLRLPSATDWYGLSVDEVCRRLDVDPAVGLSTAEVAERRQRYGPNKLAEEAKEPAWQAFLRQYRDLMQLVLVGAAVVSIVALQDVSTGVVVLGLTVVNALMGLHQEGKAAESVAALRQMLIMTASVRRDGQVVEVPAEELVPGDIVELRGGRQGPRRRPHPGGGDAGDRGSRADRREHSGGQEHRSGRRHRRAARRPGRHGLHELAGHPRPRRDRRHGHRACRPRSATSPGC